MRDEGYDALAENRLDGNECKAWFWHGYSGVATKYVSVGSREDGDIVRLEGYAAAKSWSRIASQASNVTRIDLQVTAVSEPPVKHIAWEAYKSASRVTGMGAGRIARPAITMSPTGETFYLGSRASDRFGRVYDKHAQSDGTYPAGAWRWEVEYKGNAAFAMARLLSEQPFGEQVIPRLVHSYFSKHGHAPPWPETFDLRAFVSIKEDSSVEQSLRWLREGVAPRIRDLAQIVGSDTVLAALGLEHLRAERRAS